MSGTSGADAEDTTLADRLIEIADELIGANAVDSVTIEAVAAAAGVSRATAFRRLGRRDDMIAAVALRRTAKYVTACQDEMDSCTGVFNKISAAFRFVVREVPKDLALREFFVIRSLSAFDTDVHDLAATFLKPIFEQGQRDGAIRTDAPMSDLVTWTLEQAYLAVQQNGRSEEAAIDRVNRFLAPALAPRIDATGASAAARVLIQEVSASLDRARKVLSENGSPTMPPSS